MPKLKRVEHIAASKTSKMTPWDRCRFMREAMGFKKPSEFADHYGISRARWINVENAYPLLARSGARARAKDSRLHRRVDLDRPGSIVDRRVRQTITIDPAGTGQYARSTPAAQDAQARLRPQILISIDVYFRESRPRELAAPTRRGRTLWIIFAQAELIDADLVQRIRFLLRFREQMS
jgi:hypothetical protein